MSSMSCPSPLPLCIFGYTVQCQVKKDPKSLVLPTHSLPYSFFLVSLPLSLVMINSGRCVVHWHTHTLHIHACAKKKQEFFFAYFMAWASPVACPIHDVSMQDRMCCCCCVCARWREWRCVFMCNKLSSSRRKGTSHSSTPFDENEY